MAELSTHAKSSRLEINPASGAASAFRYSVSGQNPVIPSVSDKKFAVKNELQPFNNASVGFKNQMCLPDAIFHVSDHVGSATFDVSYLGVNNIKSRLTDCRLQKYVDQAVDQIALS